MLKHLFLLVAALGVLTCSAGAELILEDSFDNPWMFNVDGVGETGWDGLVGLDLAVPPLVNSNLLAEGQLYMDSTGSNFDGGGVNPGPYLYKVVEGNFIASVQVTGYAGDANTPVYHNSCGLMARNVNLEDAGDNDDFVAVDYFPIWGQGNILRNADNGVRVDAAKHQVAWELAPFLQIERAGNLFICRISYDGETWDALGDPVVRNDFHGLPVAIGLYQAVYSDNVGSAAFDNFKLESTVLTTPQLVVPATGAIKKEMPIVLEWVPGDTAVSHQVLLGVDADSLQVVDTVADNSLEITDLDIGDYVWQVIALDDAGTAYASEIGSFSIAAPDPTVFPMVAATIDFEAAQDFLVEGVADSFFDGLVGGENANAVNASVTQPGRLYLESVDAAWSPDWSKLGPYLYKVVKGDFVATVEVADFPGLGDPNLAVYHNNASLMARVMNDEDAGAGEDWVSVDYFPIWNVGNIVRTADNGQRMESANQATAWDGARYLQLERQGNTFIPRISVDGLTWQAIGDPIVRDDFDGLPVQIGMAQATFSGNMGFAAFDNFSVQQSFVDDFEVSKDFLADGVAGTAWDGLIGVGEGETADVIDANMSSPGALQLASVGATYSPPWSPLGPCLYKVVSGNFVATVQVVDYPGLDDPNLAVYHNNASLMARNVSNEDAGAGEDWVSVDYFPIWNVGNIVRTADDGARAESANQGTGWDGMRFLQLERQGNTFTPRISADGLTWQVIGDPIVRDDFDGLPVQVGVAQATFSDNAGSAAFDGFSIVTNE